MSVQTCCPAKVVDTAATTISPDRLGAVQPIQIRAKHRTAFHGAAADRLDSLPIVPHALQRFGLDG
jgi:hypothetical protein